MFTVQLGLSQGFTPGLRGDLCTHITYALGSLRAETGLFGRHDWHQFLRGDGANPHTLSHAWSKQSRVNPIPNSQSPAKFTVSQVTLQISRRHCSVFASAVTWIVTAAG